MTPDDATIVQVFQSIRKNFSADRVVVDPELNRNFCRSCHEAGLTLTAADLNRQLLNIRKRGLLPRAEVTVSTCFRNEEEYRFGVEIAVRVIQRRDGHSLDKIICDPDLSCRLDELAQEIVPGYSPLQYRWAALNLRKAKKLSPEILSRVIQSQSVIAFKLDGLKQSAIPPEQGLYLFYEPRQTLYVGEATNLRVRLKKHLDHSDNRGLARWLWENGTGAVWLEIHVLPASTPTSHRRALETELIRSREPLFNVKR